MMSKFADNNFTGEGPGDITRENSGQISGESSGESSGENSREEHFQIGGSSAKHLNEQANHSLLCYATIVSSWQQYSSQSPLMDGGAAGGRRTIG